jgi:ferredoxin-NADP reductase
MIVSLHAKKLRIPITLLVSFSQREDFIFYHELTKIAEEMPNICIMYSVSQNGKQWDGEKGRISEEMIKKNIVDITVPIYSIVGGVEMVDDTTSLLLQMGIPSDRIKIEYFTGY